MKEIDGKKVSQEEINHLLLKACSSVDLANVIKYVEFYNGDVNASDHLNYARALVYALRGCNGKDSKGELIVKYLVNNGAEINFKHGDKGSNMNSRPYFIYYACTSTLNVSDDLVYFLIKKGGKDYLTYRPTTKIGSSVYTSALEVIRTNRPELFDKLVKEKIISSRMLR